MRTSKSVKHISYFDFIVFYYIILGVLNWINNNQTIVTIFIPIILWVAYHNIRKCWNWYFLTFPFTVKEAYENYDYYKTGKKRSLSRFFELIHINCINNEWQKKNFNLYLIAKRKVVLRQFNLRLVEKNWLQNPNDISENIISIKNIGYPQDKYKSEFSCNDDKKGGFDCYFNPPLELSKSNVLFFEIFPKVSIQDRISCKISLDNSSGEDKRTFSRKKVIVTNELIQ